MEAPLTDFDLTELGGDVEEGLGSVATAKTRLDLIHLFGSEKRAGKWVHLKLRLRGSVPQQPSCVVAVATIVEQSTESLLFF